MIRHLRTALLGAAVFSFPIATTHATEALRVATYNVEALNFSSAGYTALVNILKRMDADVVCLQEITNNAEVPQVATLVIVVLVPAALLVAFHLGERALSQWLGSGFDKDAEMLELITSGDFASSPPGQYLSALKRNLEGPLVADILCYLRVYTELSLRAKGLLMMRESGFAASAMDDETKGRFDELRYLEGTIGPAGLRAMQPLMHMSRQDLWQLYMLEKGK